MWTDLMQPFASVDTKWLEFYTLFVIDRQPVNLETGKYLRNNLLNPFAFFSKLAIPPAANGAVFTDLETEITKLRSLWTKYYDEIELFQTEPLQQSALDEIELGYVLDNKPFKLTYRTPPAQLPSEEYSIMLNDASMLLEFMFLMLLVNRQILRDATNQRDVTLAVMMTWEIAGYLFLEVFYKPDTAMDKIFNETFRRKRLSRIVKLVLLVYTADVVWANLQTDVLPNIFKSAGESPLYDNKKKKFIMQNIIQRAGKGVHSMFTYSLTKKT